jgi:hypothetical protein
MPFPPPLVFGSVVSGGQILFNASVSADCGVIVSNLSGAFQSFIFQDGPFTITASAPGIGTKKLAVSAADFPQPSNVLNIDLSTP